MLEKIRTAVAIAFGRKTPFTVTHHITYRCNLDCDMCGLKRLSSVQEMATDVCIDLLQDFRNHGTVFWGYSGGEPLIREDLEQLYYFAKKIGMHTILHTNGILLPQRIEICNLIDAIEIGIDGGRGTHDSLRGSGSFDKAVAGLEAIVRLKSARPRITILTILNNLSIQPDQLDEMMRLALEYDAKVSFTLASVHRVDDRLLRNASKYTPSASQFKDFRIWLEREKAGPRGGVFQDNTAFFRSLGNFPDYPHRISCQAGRLRCVVEPTGLVLPCADMINQPINFLPRGKRFGYGYKGFLCLPKTVSCDKQYCYTAKSNFNLQNPWRILSYYYLNR